MLALAPCTCTLDAIRFIRDELPPGLAATLGAGGAKGVRKVLPGTAREIGLPPDLARAEDREGIGLNGLVWLEPSLPRLKV